MLTPVQLVDRVAGALQGQLPALADRASVEVRRRLPAYVEASDPAGHDLGAVAYGALAVMLSALQSDGSVLGLDEESLRRTAARRSEEGVELGTLLEVLSIYTRVVMDAFEKRAAGSEWSADAVGLAERRIDRVMVRMTICLTRGYLDAAERRWMDQNAKLEALMQIARAVNASLELADVAHAGLAATLRAMNLDAGALWMVSAHDESLALAYTVAMTPEEDRSMRGRPPQTHALAVRAAELSEPVQSHDPRGHPGLDAYSSTLALALRHAGELMGVYIVASRRAREFTPPELTFFSAVADLLAPALRRAERHRREARTDYLTGLANRPEFERAMARAIAASERQRRPLSLMLIDLDRLKAINDSGGHHAGDLAIRRVADGVRKAVRATDTCARLGGDEFAVAMPEAGIRQAEEVGRRLRELLGQVYSKGAQVPLEVSLGLASWEPGMDSASLFKLADARLYREKRAHAAGRRQADAGRG